MHSQIDSVAQLVEQKTLNLWVLGSSPSGVTVKAEITAGDEIKIKLIKPPDFWVVFYLTLKRVSDLNKIAGTA